MGNLNSKVEHFESSMASHNGFYLTWKGPLYLPVLIKSIHLTLSKSLSVYALLKSYVNESPLSEFVKVPLPVSRHICHREKIHSSGPGKLSSAGPYPSSLQASTDRLWVTLVPPSGVRIILYIVEELCENFVCLAHSRKYETKTLLFNPNLNWYIILWFNLNPFWYLFS